MHVVVHVSKALVCTFVGLFILAQNGCIVPSQQALRTNESLAQNTKGSDVSSVQPDRPLLKPRIPEKEGSKETPEKPDAIVPGRESEDQSGSEQLTTQHPYQKEHSRTESHDALPVAERKPKPFLEDSQQRKSDEHKWEDQAVKDAAIEIARSFPQTKKIKICYSINDDEWWVTLYDFTDSFIDLKQFTWNRETKKLEPFLVLKKIPPNRLQEHLSEEESGKACEVVDSPFSSNLSSEPVRPPETTKK